MSQQPKWTPGQSKDEKRIDRMTKVWNEIKLDPKDFGCHAGIPHEWSTGGDGGDVFEGDAIIARTSERHLLGEDRPDPSEKEAATAKLLAAAPLMAKTLLFHHTLDMFHDMLSDLLEDPDSDPEEIRRAATSICAELVGQADRRHQALFVAGLGGADISLRKVNRHE